MPLAITKSPQPKGFGPVEPSLRVGPDRRAIKLYQTRETTMLYLATNIPANEAHIVKADPEDAWGNDNPDGWTYQELAGPGFTIVAEFDNAAKADAAHAEFLGQA